jgi:hypothetical protein
MVDGVKGYQLHFICCCPHLVMLPLTIINDRDVLHPFLGLERYRIYRVFDMFENGFYCTGSTIKIG